MAAAIKVTADAEATSVRVTGLAAAEAIEAQVKASGGPDFQLRRTVSEQLSTAVREAQVAIVPSVVVSGSETDGNGMVQALLAMVARQSQRLGDAPS